MKSYLVTITNGEFIIDTVQGGKSAQVAINRALRQHKGYRLVEVREW